MNTKGSGGLIQWNPSSHEGEVDENGDNVRPAFIGLVHEMAHASDANKGLLYPSKIIQIFHE